MEQSGEVIPQTAVLDPAIQSTFFDGTHLLIPRRASLSRCFLDGFAAERKLFADALRNQVPPPDLIHLHWPQFSHGLGGFDVGIPIVVTMHDSPLDCAFWNWNWRPGPVIVNTFSVLNAFRVLRRANAVLAVSPYAADRAREVFRPHAKVRMIPCPCVDSSEAHPRSKAHFPQDGGVLALLGHWGPLKNIPLALRAFHLLRQKRPNARLLLVGKDLHPGSDAHRWAVRNKLDAGVEFKGSMPNSAWRELLGSTVDLLLQPSRTEGFGLAVAEALHEGVPVLVSNAGSLPWLAGARATPAPHRSQGNFICDEWNPGVWAHAIHDLLSDPAIRHLVTPLQNRIQQLTNPREIARLHTNLYREVLTHRGARRE